MRVVSILIGVSLVIAFIAVIINISQRKPSRDQLQDYQIKLHMDTVWIYDSERLVGKYINTKWDSQLDSIILKDNL